MEKGGVPVIILLDKILIDILYAVLALFSLDDARNSYFYENLSPIPDP